MQKVKDNGAKASINFQRCDLRVAPFHNAREAFLPDTSHPELIEKNECSCSALAALKKIKKWDALADEAYLKTYGQKSALREKNKVWECVINLRENHTLKDVKKLTKKLEKITGYRAAQIAVHKDEGHYEDTTGDFIQNVHAHVIFFARSTETGISLSAENYRRKDLMRQMQDVVASELGMERGQSAEITGAKHMSPRAYKAQKRQEAKLEKTNAEWEQKLEQNNAEWEARKAEWERKQAEREARREEWERKLPEIMEARRRNEQFLNSRVDWETLKTANKAFLLWHDISTDLLGYPNPNGNLIVEQAKGSLASIFRLFGTVSQLAIFLLTRTEARELKLKNAMNVYKVSENLQRAVNLVANDTSNDHKKIAEKIQSVFTNLPQDKRQELIELAILHAPNSEIREDIRAVVEGRFSDIARTEQAQTRIDEKEMRRTLREYSEEARKIRDELKQMDEENRILNLAERALLKDRGANREQYANQEEQNRGRIEDINKLKDEAKKLKKDLDEARKQQEVDKNTLKEQAEKIAELTSKIAEITKENVAKQRELEAEKAKRKEAEIITPQMLQDAFSVIDELEEKLKQPEPVKPEPVKPEPEQPKPAKDDDYLNIFGYSRPQPEPRRRFSDDYERKTYDDRPKYEPIHEPEQIEPEKPREEPIFRDPWQKIENDVERWKKCQSEVEKNIIKTEVLKNIEKYEKSGWDIPLHRQMSIDSFRRTINYDPAAAIHRERERELERKRQAEIETTAIKYEEVKKNVRQEDDARQKNIKKKRKDELEMGMS